MGVLPWWAVWLCRGTAEHSCLAHPAISAARCLGPGRSRGTPVPWAWDLCLKAFRFIRRTDEVCLLIYGWEASFCTLSALPLRTWMLLWLRHTCAFQCRQCLHGVKSGDSAQFLKEKNYLFVLAAFFLITSSPAHCELSLKGVALVPRSLPPCAWLPIASPTAQATRGDDTNPPPHHHSPPLTPSPGTFFSFKSSCHLTLTALLLRCASAHSLSWFRLVTHSTAKERHISNFR